MKKAGIIFLLSAIVITSCGCSKNITTSGKLITESESSIESSVEDVTSIQESSEKSEISYSPNYGYGSDTEDSSEPESSYEPETSEVSTYEQTHYEKAIASKYYENMDKYTKDYLLCFTNTKSEQNLFRTDGENKIWYFFDFTQKGTVGIGLFDKARSDKYNDEYINDTIVAYTEMYYGFKAEIIDGRTLSVENYTNLSGVEYTNLEIQYERPDRTCPNYTVDYDKTTLTADLYDESFINGCYAITGTYKYKDETNTCNLYLYVNCESNDPSDYNFYICHGENSGHQYEDDDLPNDININTNKLIKESNITAEDSLSLNIMYPYCAIDCQTPVFDTPNWISKSNTIVANYESANHKSVSKAFKATLLHDWMVKNMAYDDYKIDHLNGKPRYANYCDTDEFYPSHSHVGVCLDFANIYMIMCREQGIPCITCENEEETHVWNMIYIDGQWTEVDITYDITYYAETEDVNKWDEDINNKPYEYYFNCPKHEAHDIANSVNKCLHEY